MHTRIRHILWIGCLFFGLALAGAWVGCAAEVKPECKSELDCGGSNKVCVENKCVDQPGEGDACDTLKGLSCLPENKDTPPRPLICVGNVCKVKCSTNFDCKTRDGETCDTSTGICKKQTGGDAGEIVTEAPPGKGESEECGPSVACASGLDCVKRSSNLNEGRCWKGCSKDSDCASGQICTGTHCVPQNDTCEIQGGQEVKPCWPGLKCVLEGAASGSCLRACTQTSECPTDYECATKGTAKYCVPKGNRAGAGQPCGEINGQQVGCIDGYQCAKERLEDTKTICLKKCAKDEECAWPAFCQSICTLGNAGTAKLGEACSVASNPPADKRCEGGHYCLVLGQNQKEGFCYRDCGDPRKTDCPSGLTCLPAGTNQKLCFKTCSAADDCKSNTPATSCGKLGGGNDQICLHPSN